MALVHFLVLAVALPAIFAGPTNSNGKLNCTEAETKNIKDQWIQIKTCFGNLIDPRVERNLTCISMADIEKFREPFLEAAKCAISDNYAVNESYSVLIKIMNMTVANNNFLELIQTGNISRCVEATHKDLVNCVNTTVVGQSSLVQQLGQKQLILSEIFSANFQQAAAQKTAQDLQKCIHDIWNKNDKCSGMSEFISALLDIGMKQFQRQETQSAPSVQIASSILMATAALLIL